MSDSSSAIPQSQAHQQSQPQHILSFALMQSHQQLLRLSVSAILHSLRVARVPRVVLDLLSQVMASFLQRLLQRLAAFALGEGRHRLTLAEDSVMMLDLFFSANRLFCGGHSPLLSMEPGWKFPPFELELLLDFARNQQRVVVGVKRRPEQSEGDEYRSVYEEAGLINSQFALIPLPTRQQQPSLAIHLCEDEEAAEAA